MKWILGVFLVPCVFLAAYSQRALAQESQPGGFPAESSDLPELFRRPLSKQPFSTQAKDVIVTLQLKQQGNLRMEVPLHLDYGQKHTTHYGGGEYAETFTVCVSRTESIATVHVRYEKGGKPVFEPKLTFATGRVAMTTIEDIQKRITLTVKMEPGDESRRSVTLKFQDIDIGELIKIHELVSGADIEVPQALRGTISVTIDNVPWNQSLVAVVRNFDMYYPVWEKAGKVRLLPEEEYREHLKKLLKGWF